MRNSAFILNHFIFLDIVIFIISVGSWKVTIIMRSFDEKRFEISRSKVKTFLLNLVKEIVKGES